MFFIVYKPLVHSLGLQPSFQALDPAKENEQSDGYLLHTVINQTLWCLKHAESKVGLEKVLPLLSFLYIAQLFVQMHQY